MTQGDVIDLFSGAGGWCEGAKPLGLRPLGIEWDKAPCATREAAGHRTLRADVAALDPADFAPCMGLIASPPCPTFSTAGRGAGRLLTDVIVRALHELPAGADTRRERRDEAYEILLPIALGVEREGAHRRDRPADLEKAARTALRDATMSGRSA